MAALVVGGVLLGAGLLLKKRSSLPADDGDDDEGMYTAQAPLPPSAETASLPSFGGANSRIQSVPIMRNRAKDDNIDTSQSLSDRLRWMPAPTPLKSETPVVGQMFSPSLNAVDNVHVRTKDITRTELQHMNRPTIQNNALPFEQMMVGPGVGIDARDSTGTQGFHYGANRMMPTDIYNHQRGQRGVIVPGKSEVDKPTATPYMRKLRPDRFFEVSEEYQTSAPGRSTATGAATRTEPQVRYTNRATETFNVGHAAAVGVTGVSDRLAYDNFIDTSQRGQRNPAVGQPSRDVGAGYILSEQGMMTNDNQRTTTQSADQSLLPIDNPGQPLFMPSDTAPRATLREGMPTLPMGILAPNAPDAPPRESSQPLRTTDRQLTQTNEYIGPAQSMFSVSSEQIQKDAVAAGRVSQPTMKQLTHDSYVGNARTSVNNPMSYSDILTMEGYSNKIDEQSDRMSNPGRVNIPVDKDFTRTELSEEAPNTSRSNNLQRSAQTNMYVRNDLLDVNPNKELPNPNRLDPSLLTDNELFPKIK